MITRIEGQMAYVDEDGFETPVLLRDVVVVLPSGHEPAQGGGRLMFDQKAVDSVKARDAKSRLPEPLTKDVTPVQAPPAPVPVEETAHGEKLNLALAFEPEDVKRLSTTRFAAVLVNDSNYYLSFQLLRRADGHGAWQSVWQGELEPNTVLDVDCFGQDSLAPWERICFQAIAYKKGKPFSPMPPVWAERRVDLKKFFKLHCFQPGRYFDSPVMELPLVTDGEVVNPMPVDAPALQEALCAPSKPKAKPGKKSSKPVSPYKLLPPVEVDLHIAELVDTTAGMQPADMLHLQLEAVRRTMREHDRRKGQKIIFIHGKGDGVLRDEVRRLLRREWGKAELQDASFREYGFGATLVTVH